LLYVFNVFPFLDGPQYLLAGLGQFQVLLSEVENDT
jgi:hypothetical protein